ncbi:MAG: tetratricopeptide repeat protein [Bacteroidota bacterium]
MFDLKYKRIQFRLLFVLAVLFGPQCSVDFIYAQTKENKKIDILIKKSRAALDTGNYIATRQNAQEAYLLAKEEGNDEKQAIANNYIGISHELQGEFAEAIEYYLKALGIQKRIKDTRNISSTYTNLGLVYWTQKDLKKALNYFNQSLKYNKLNNDTNGMSSSYNNIGLIYMDSSNYELSATYFLKSIYYDSITGNKNGIGSSYNNLGLIFRKDKDYVTAEKYFRLAVAIHKESGDKYGLMNSITNLGVLKEDKKDFAEAEKFYQLALKIALESGNKNQCRVGYKSLYSLAEARAHHADALQYYKLMSLYADSIANDEQLVKQTEAEMQFSFDQQTEKTKLLQQKDDLINEQARQRLIWWIIGMIIFGILISVFALMINKRRKLEMHQKEIIAQKNQEILDSIQYAKRIQNAILPTEQQLNEYLSNYFIYYKPKDIVAGDFYWMEKIGSKILVAVADCTGHGVPGALISVVCHNALNRSVREFHLTEPGEILNKTRQLILEEFMKSDEKMRDGMDISLCCLDVTSLELKWSGANSPLWIKRHDKTELEIYKAQKQPIGYFDVIENFTTLNFQLQKGDAIYLFSDGYADQFGGPNGKKLKSNGMRNLILSVSEKSMSEQNTAFDTYFENWKLSHEQIDDVCVFGFQV